MITKEELFEPENFFVGFLNLIPHAKQLEVLNNTAKHKTICTGRRAGKSKMIAGEILRGAYSQTYKKQGVLAPTYKQVLIIYNEIMRRMEENKLMHDVQKHTEHPYPQIILTNGSLIDFMSADNPDSVRGFDYDRLFVDEAGQISEKGWQAIRPLTFDTGAPIWQTSTPFGKNSFYHDFQRGLRHDGDYASFQFGTLDNPYINKEAVLKEIEEYGESSVYVQTEIFGNFVEDVDMFFPFDLVNACSIDYEMYEVVL